MNIEPHYKIGDKIAGRFLVYKALMGGMGEVYLCLDIKKNEPHALKTFQSRFISNPELRKTFDTEVATWVALGKHPNIVRCFHMRYLDNRPFMFLEWIVSDENGRTDLRSWLHHGQIDFRTALDFTIDICHGLIHAEKKQPGIVHRDLKPENILVTREKIARITDFGLATIAKKAAFNIPKNTNKPKNRHSLFGRDGIVGTPPYMAPEQWCAETVDSRTDVYAIGCILYELLTGQVPFGAAEPDDLRTMHIESPIPKLPNVITHSSALSNLLSRCLAKRREERFKVDDLLSQLSNIYQLQFNEIPLTTQKSTDFKYYDYSDRGMTYHLLHRYEEALIEFNRAIELNPSSSPVYTNRGGAYFKLNRYQEALSDINHALEIDSANAVAYSHRGLVYSALQQFEDALVDHNHALELNPFSAYIYNKRGSTYKEIGRYEEALIDFNHAIELDPINTESYESRGDTYFTLERYEKALADYNRALELDPANVNVYILRSLLYVYLQQYDKALPDCLNAIKFEPTLSSSYYILAQINASHHRYEEALPNYNHAIDLKHYNMDVYYYRAFAYFKLGDYDKALLDYTFYLDKNPDNGDAYRERGRNYVQMKYYDEALADFTRAIELDPTNENAYSNRSGTYYMLNRYEEALADITSAIELNPKFALFYTNRGGIYRELKQYKKASKDLERAITLEPTHPQAFFNFATMHIDHEEWREALPYLWTASQLGHPQGEQLALQIEQRFGIESTSEAKSVQAAFISFRHTQSFDGIKLVVTEFPFIIDPEIISIIEQFISQKVSKELKPEFNQRLTWLRQIAEERK